ncbi:MAG: tetratricopeptide repeat protein [Polyangiaceae bacterium]|nr:tetratricopeptide repeat protein [Polyangiaceae bacterium]
MPGNCMVTQRRFSRALRNTFAMFAAGFVAAQVVIATPSLAQPKGAPAAAPDADTKKALEFFKKGQGLFKAKKFVDALAAFRESYKLVPSPNSQIYVARCLASTGDSVAAYLEFEALIADVDARQDPKYQPARDSAVQERDELAAKIALVTVNVTNAPPGTRVMAGGREVPEAQWGKPIPFSPGMVDVTATPPSGAPMSQQVEVRAGEKKAVNVNAAGATAAPTATAPSGPSTGTRAVLRPVAYLAGGVGAAGLIVFGVAGGLANATYGSLDSKCTKGTGTRTCPADAAGQINDGKVQKDVANVGLIVGAVGLAAGVGLFILSMDSGAKKDDAPKVQAVVGPSYLGVQGTF